MTPSPIPDDLTAVRSLLGPADPVPDPTLPREQVLAARASVGLARAHPAAAPRRRARFVAAGAVAVLAVATLVALVAVPQDEPGTVSLATGPGAQAISSAYAATARTGTARGVLTVTSGDSTLTATGAGDFETGVGRAEVELVGRPGSPAAHLTVIRTADGVYAKLPEGATPLGPGKPWVKVDAATLARLAQLAGGDIGAQLTGAPLDALAYLRAVSGDVQIVGPDIVAGEPTTRYRGVVDPQKVADQLPPALRPEAGRLAGHVGQPLPADLWIDAEGRLRKLVLTADLHQAGPAGAGAQPVTLTLVLSDFGTAVDATPPPADQVVDVGGLLGGFLGGTRRP